MKHIYSLLFFGLLSLSTHAQVYAPIPETNATWLHTWYDWNWTMPTWKQKVFTNGDTLINAVNYTKIQEFTVGQSGAMWSSYLAAFRNDETAQRVYIIPKDSLNERILYDFNVSVDDTISNAFCMEYYGGVIMPSPANEFYVEAVDSFVLGTDYRKKITLRSNQGNPGGVLWFEGFGSSQGLLGMPDMTSVSYLQQWDCATFGSEHFMNVVDSVISTASPCPTNLSVARLDAQTFSVAPNPVSSQFEVSTASSGAYGLALYNSAGEKIHDAEALIGSYTFNMEAYPSGVYLLNLCDDQGSAQHVKLVKL